jgi:hypothetical protein
MILKSAVKLSVNLSFNRDFLEIKLIGEKSKFTPLSKKSRKGELTPEQKEINQVLSSARIWVENLIRIVKIFTIARERFRLSRSRYKSVISTVCALVRLRIDTLILEIVKSPDSEQTIDFLMSHSFQNNMELEPSSPY